MDAEKPMCPRCNEEKVVLKGLCRKCYAKQAFKNWRKRNPEKYEKGVRIHSQRQYCKERAAAMLKKANWHLKIAEMLSNKAKLMLEYAEMEIR